MPERISPQSNPLERAHYAPLELTREDRERLGELLREAEIMHISDYSDDIEAVEIRRRLRDENGKAALFILELLNTGEIVPSSDSFYANLCWLNYCASEQCASDIGAFLMRDEIVFDSDDRSLGDIIIKMLERVGTEENIEQVASYASRCFDVYSTREDALDLQTADSMQAVSALSLIMERVADLNARERIEGIIRTTKENTAQRVGVSVPELENTYSYIGEYAAKRISRFQDLFEVREERIFSEDQRDDELQDAYQEHRFKEVESRLETVKRLRREIEEEQWTMDKYMQEDPEDEDTQFLRRHWLEYREDHPSPYTPTLGIEVEIREQSVLPPEAEQWSETKKEQFLNKKKSRIERQKHLA